LRILSKRIVNNAGDPIWQTTLDNFEMVSHAELCARFAALTPSTFKITCLQW